MCDATVYMNPDEVFQRVPESGCIMGNLCGDNKIRQYRRNVSTRSSLAGGCVDRDVESGRVIEPRNEFDACHSQLRIQAVAKARYERRRSIRVGLEAGDEEFRQKLDRRICISQKVDI